MSRTKKQKLLRRKKRGGCGCMKSIFSRKQKGGVSFPASFSNVPIHSFYPKNEFGSDPNYLSVASRQTGSFYGGKRRSSRRSRRSQKGGDLLSVPTLPTLKMPVSNLYDSNNLPKA